jgi:hypothetical protein
MTRAKKYGTEEERKSAKRAASARYYALNKKEENKKDLLKYYQKRVKELTSLISSSMVTSSLVDTSSFQLTAFDIPHSSASLVTLMETSSIDNSSSFQKAAANNMDREVIDYILTSSMVPTESIAIAQDFELIQFSYFEKPLDGFYINRTGSIGLELHPTYSLDVMGTCSIDDSSSFQANMDNYVSTSSIVPVDLL